MLQAVETRKSSAGGTVWFIDQLGDKTSMEKGHLLSAVVWNLVPVYSAMIEDLKTQRFGTHPYALSLADDSVHLLHTKYIADPLWQEIAAQRQRIIDGKLKVDTLWDAVKVRALMTSVTAPAK
jgi:basic membrane protein A and related proteins